MLILYLNMKSAKTIYLFVPWTLSIFFFISNFTELTKLIPSEF